MILQSAASESLLPGFPKGRLSGSKKALKRPSSRVRVKRPEGSMLCAEATLGREELDDVVQQLSAPMLGSIKVNKVGCPWNDDYL